MTGAELRALRHSLGLNNAQLAVTLGLSVSSIDRWESGKRPVPKYIALAMAGLFAEKHANETIRAEAAAYNLMVSGPLSSEDEAGIAFARDTAQLIAEGLIPR